MMKTFVRFFLALCFFLVKEDGHLLARSNQNCTIYASVRVPLKLAKNRFQGLPDNRSVFDDNLPAGTENTGDKIPATEIEEEDTSVSVKKNIELSTGALVLLVTRAPGYHAHFTNRLPFCKHFSYSSSSRHIVHCVFRV